jgi:hypothetical protein
MMYVIHWVHVDRFDNPEHAYKDEITTLPSWWLVFKL